ncbi:hypothetical protein B0H14DRAFT_2574722 [Mycena olivaceomarginata]|nr:hypothetical protein B0H14DRAFT_2574722 [Mycena olivaceomarginata]
MQEHTWTGHMRVGGNGSCALAADAGIVAEALDERVQNFWTETLSSPRVNNEVVGAKEFLDAGIMAARDQPANVNEVVGERLQLSAAMTELGMILMMCLHQSHPKMSLGKRKKKNTTITFSRLGGPSSSSSASAVKPDTTTVLREKTTIRQDGSILQARSMVTVSLDNEWSIPKVHPDVVRPPEPIYESYSAADHGGEDNYDDDEGGRDLRASDDPLRQWTEDHRETYLVEMLRQEGRSDYTEATTCSRCLRGTADHRCNTCMGGGELLCDSCTVATHLQLPFHTIQRWTGSWFERRALKDMGLRIQLGHWGSDAACPVPQAAPGDDFVIVDTLGVHPVHLDYCNCGQGGHHTVQLLQARLWPATTTNPRTAATFSVLRQYQLLSFESKCAALEFYQSLARTNDNLHYKKEKDRYHEFLRMTRQWRNIQMLKQAGRGHDMTGVSGTGGGESQKEFATRTGKMRRKKNNVSSEEKDPGLGNGWAFYCEVLAVHAACETKLESEAGLPQRSHCVAHDTVDKPDRDARGTASSGIGAVDCARHNMKRPLAVGDLQLGERVAGSDLLQFFVSYDIACQWSLHIWERMIKYQDETLTLDGRGRFFTFLVPKFHLPAHIEACNLKYLFNLTPRVGQTDGEAPERGWANANPLARSTKEMGPGFRRDTLDDHFNDWNHKKIIALGYTMRRKVEKAVPEMVATRLALADMNTSLSLEVVKEWTEMAEKWEADADAPNPFETIHKDQHVASPARELAGQEDADAVRGDMHITELIAMGLQLEQQQRVLASDVAATGLHPTDGQRRAMMERSSKLRRKIVAWINVQQKFFPALANIRAREDELWLPLHVASAPAAAAEVVIKDAVFLHEYRLRVGIAAEALHDVRRPSERRQSIGRRVQQLVVLGRRLGRMEWEWTLLPLLEEDVRGLPQSHFHDPERKKKQKRRKRWKKVPSKLSWIWVNRGESWDPSDNVAINEAVRIEWAKTRARAMRWAEEVDLLEEEMRCIVEFLRWRSGRWKARVNMRGLAEGPQLEGETAYAMRQANIQATLASEFLKEWKGLAQLIQDGRTGEGGGGCGGGWEW